MHKEREAFNGQREILGQRVMPNTRSAYSGLMEYRLGSKEDLLQGDIQQYAKVMLFRYHHSLSVYPMPSPLYSY